MFCRSLALGLFDRSVAYVVKRALYFGLLKPGICDVSCNPTIFSKYSRVFSCCCHISDSKGDPDHKMI